MKEITNGVAVKISLNDNAQSSQELYSYFSFHQGTSYTQPKAPDPGLTEINSISAAIDCMGGVTGAGLPVVAEVIFIRWMFLLIMLHLVA